MTMHADGLPAGDRVRVFAEAARLQARGSRAVLAIPLWTAGSTPIPTRARLLMREDGSALGTIGGGPLEARALAEAPQVLSQDRPRLLEFLLTGEEAAESGMICGGRCAVLLEPVVPGRHADVYAAAAAAEVAGDSIVIVTILSGETIQAKLAVARGRRLLAVSGDRCLDQQLWEMAERTLATGRSAFITEPSQAHFDPIVPEPTAFIFGAGHVAIPLAHLAHLLGFRVVVIDDRSDFADPQRFPQADRVLVASVPGAFRQLCVDESGFVIAITRGHALDEEVVAEALRTPARYIGMIGSNRKVAEVRSRLHRRGFSERDIARLHAPIGIDIGSETPTEIAVSIAAEIIAVRQQAVAAPDGDGR